MRRKRGKEEEYFIPFNTFKVLKKQMANVVLPVVKYAFNQSIYGVL